MRWKAAATTVIVTLSFAQSAAGQAGRRQTLIQQARNEFDDNAGLQLLMTALDPALGPQDSLWAVAGYDLARTLLRTQQQPLATTWMRWLARHASAKWPMDRTWYPTEVQTVYDQAVAAVAAGDTVPTTWRWPSRFDATLRGSVEASAAGRGVPLTVTVEGAGDLPAGGGLSLVPGTYTLVASADGYESTRTTREVLPGVATIVNFDLAPLLPSAIETSVASSLVRIRFANGADQVCRNGMLAGDDGLVLTTFGAVRGASGLRVEAFNGEETFNDVEVVATDANLDLAVLRLTTQRAQAMTAAPRIDAGQYAWAVHFAGCGAPTTDRIRIPQWPATPRAAVAFAPVVPADAAGAPLVDRSGLFIGLVSGPGSVIPAALTQGILDRARRPIVAAPPIAAETEQLGPPRKKFPWIWVGAGVAAAGLGVALASGSGGGGGTDTTPKPTTGGIIITFPN
jgi:Trypsin-like peptidase domain